MICFSLTCSNDHLHESWFASGAAFDSLRAAGHLACPSCGDSTIEKALMAPRVRPSDTGAEAPRAMALSGPAGDPVTAALAKLKKLIEAHSEDVGTNFAAEARAIHDGERPARSIWGQARPEEARKLVEDGIPVAPLPFIPTRKTN